MTDLVVPRQALELFLGDLDAVGYAVAKNPELWANLDRGGDWDLVVSDLDRAEAALLHRLGAPRRTYGRGSLRAYHYGWGEIDLLGGFEWRGIDLVSADRVVKGARHWPAGGRIARLAHQAFAGWVLPTLWGGSFRDRYVDVVADAVSEDAGELESILRSTFGDRVGMRVFSLAAAGLPHEVVRHAPMLRLALLARACRRAMWPTVAGSMRFYAAEMAGLFRTSFDEPIVVTSHEDVTDLCALVRSNAGAVAGVAVVDERGRLRGTVEARHLTEPTKVWQLIESSSPATRPSNELLRRLERRRLRDGWIFVQRSDAARPGTVLCLVGPDGTGKSTVADAIVSALPGRFMHRYWRPGVLPMLGRLVGRSMAPGTNSDPHSRKSSGFVKAIVWTLYYFVDFTIGHWLLRRRARRSGQMVIMERGWQDMVVDPRRYGLRGTALTRLLSPAVPRPEFTVVLDVPPDICLERKPELPVEEIDRQLTQWRTGARSRTRTLIVDGTRPVDDIVGDILRNVGPAATPTGAIIGR